MKKKNAKNIRQRDRETDTETEKKLRRDSEASTWRERERIEEKSEVTEMCVRV